MRLHRSPFRRVPFGEYGYNEQFGPAGPYCWGPCPATEWDDPTWLSAEVDEEYMAAAAARLDRYVEQQQRAERKRTRKRKSKPKGLNYRCCVCGVAIHCSEVVDSRDGVYRCWEHLATQRKEKGACDGGHGRVPELGGRSAGRGADPPAGDVEAERRAR